MMTSLVELDVNSNGLTGELSSAWSALRKLQFLDASSNGLTGQLKEDWTTLSKLDYSE